ncbi:MAG: cytochrome C, partial [Planctomycetota bacterium]
MRSLLTAAALVAVIANGVAVMAQTARSDEPASGCLECHQGIEPIREASSGMAEEILALGRTKDDPAGCVVCHGGDPKAKEKEAAHQGKAFYPDPGSPWINRRTCGLCHPDHVRVQWHSLMLTEAGKIQGTAWAFGSLT